MCELAYNLDSPSYLYPVPSHFLHLLQFPADYHVIWISGSVEQFICRNPNEHCNNTGHETSKTKKAFSFWGGLALPPRASDLGLCPWTPLGALPQDPRSRTRHILVASSSGAGTGVVTAAELLHKARETWCGSPTWHRGRTVSNTSGGWQLVPAAKLTQTRQAETTNDALTTNLLLVEEHKVINLYWLRKCLSKRPCPCKHQRI